MAANSRSPLTLCDYTGFATSHRWKALPTAAGIMPAATILEREMPPEPPKEPPDKSPKPPDLFDYAHARRGDADTSHEAVPVNITAQARRVLHSYRCNRPLTDHDAYRLAGFAPGRITHQRCSDLRFRGMIELTGERGITPSGKSARLSRITTAGWSYLLDNKDSDNG